MSSVLFFGGYARKNPGLIAKIYDTTRGLIRYHKACGEVVVLGSKKLINECDMVFFQNNDSIRRKNFDKQLEIDAIMEDFNNNTIYLMNCYLDAELQKYARHDAIPLAPYELDSYR